MKRSRRIAAFVLVAAMVFSALPMNAFAAETQKDTGGLCALHPEHTADCGYAQAVPERPCTHTHSESCYALVTQCVHTHEEGCAPAAVTDEAAAPAEEPAGCAHQCSEESGCVTKKLACTHQHDDQCGYAPGVEEQPCAFPCTVCNAQKQEEPAAPECICETPCTAEAVNKDCPVCGAEDGDLTQCQGAPAQEEIVCTCTEACTAEAVNQDCPVCGAENGDLTQCQGAPAQEEPSCTCTEACTAEAVNQDCPVCGAEDSDLTQCQGAPAQEEIVCTCTEACTAETVNKDCPVCGAENADLTQCKGKAPEEQVKAVQALVDALPTVEELEAMTAEEQQAVYEKLQAAYAAYQALTPEQQAQITEAEKLDSLLSYFADQTDALIDGVTYLDANGSEQTANDVTVVASDMTSWQSGWYVVDSDVTIGSRVTVNGEVHLILADNASLTVNGGINVADSNGFSVYAQSTEGNMGALTATSTARSLAGIGGGKNSSGGNITINGGTVTAIAKEYDAAGIGGGSSGSGGNITINGGTVNATGGGAAAGIGGGSNASGGNITINGGVVNATGDSAGIGGGHKGSGGNITIRGGSVTATGGGSSAGIGGGSEGSVGTVTIYGGSVTATGGWHGPGIGGGYFSSKGGTVTIHGGSVTAIGGSNSAGIGNGFRAYHITVTIYGGSVTATGGANGAGIGNGYNGQYSTVTIHGGSVTATGGNQAAGIGGGGSISTVTIDGGSVIATGNGAAGIGKGKYGLDVTFETGPDGHALIVANGGIGDKSKKDSWSGIIFDGDDVGAYGNQTLSGNLEITGNQTLTVPEGSTLTVPQNVTITCDTIFTNDGTIEGYGTLDGAGDLVGSGSVAPTITNNLQRASTVAVTVSQSTAVYGSQVTITAKIAKAANTYTAAEKQVEFSVGNVSLGTVDVNNNEASVTVTLSEEKGFAIGENIITAQYGGSMGLKPQTGRATLTIERITPNPTTPTGLTAVYGQTLADVSLPEKWAWDAPETSVGNVGEKTFHATYTEDNSGHYNPVTKDLTVQVTPAAYQITLTGQPDSPIQITLDEAAVEPGNTGTKVTYGCSSTNAAPDSWQAERVFSGLTADTTYYFFAKAEATANYAETISHGVAITTPKKSTSKLEISHQPDHLSYTSGQTLDLSGLSVKVYYNDNTSEILTWDSGKLTADPAQGTVLRAAKHNGKTISVSYGGKTVETQALTVKKAAQATLSITGAATYVQIILKAETLDKLVSSNVKHFTIDTDCMTDFGFDQDILKELDRQTSGDIVFKVKKTAPSSDEAKAAIGTRPAYDISMWEVKNGKETQLTDLNGKAISIAIPYTPAGDEQPGRVYAVSVDAAGKVQWITKSSCDGDQKAVIFHLTQPGIFAVGYDAQVPAFTDIENHWAEDNILFAVSRGLLDGTSETTFSPDSGMTRGMFATALGRLAGIDPDSYQTGKFTDVKADADYAPYVNWAASKGIMAGTSATTFAPDSTITREQMVVIMKNYAARMGNTIPETLEAVTFADNASISSEAKETVKSLQQAGILTGKTDNRFDLAGTATRAEVATVLRRFVEIVVDPQTANGWVQNGSGEWSHYKNGELVKGWLVSNQKRYWLDETTGKLFSDGWKRIDGKQYYFYADGSMAVNTTVDGYQVGTDGARTN